jgi:hypothetical protein
LAAEREQRKSTEGGAGELFAKLSSDHELFVRECGEFVKADQPPFQPVHQGSIFTERTRLYKLFSARKEKLFVI